MALAQHDGRAGNVVAADTYPVVAADFAEVHTSQLSGPGVGAVTDVEARQERFSQFQPAEYE